MIDKNYELNLAAKEGDFAKVKELIEKDHVDVNARATIECNTCFILEGSTPLHQACQSLRLDVVRYLVEKGANVNAKAGLLAYTPLHAVALCYEAFKGRDDGNLSPQREIVNILLENGAEPLATTNNKWDGNCYTATDFANKYHHVTVREAISIFLAKNKQPQHEKIPQGMCSISLMSEEQAQRIVDVITQLILKTNPKANINNDRRNFSSPLNVIYKKEEGAIKIFGHVAISYDGSINDIDDDVIVTLSNMPENILIYTKFLGCHKGSTGREKYIGLHFVIFQADLEKLLRKKQELEELEQALGVIESPDLASFASNLSL